VSFHDCVINQWISYLVVAEDKIGRWKQHQATHPACILIRGAAQVFVVGKLGKVRLHRCICLWGASCLPFFLGTLAMQELDREIQQKLDLVMR
jgi:hypothetical protein